DALCFGHHALRIGHDAHDVERHHVIERVVVELQVERVALCQEDVSPPVAVEAVLGALEHLGREIDTGHVTVVRIGVERQPGPDADLEHARAGLDSERSNHAHDARIEDAAENEVVEMRELVVEGTLVRLRIGNGHPILPPSTPRRVTPLHRPSELRPTPNPTPRGGTGRHAAVVPRSSRLKDMMSRRRNRHCRPRLNAGKTLLRASSLTVSGLRSSISATSLLFNSMSSLSCMLRPTRHATTMGRSRAMDGGQGRTFPQCSSGVEGASPHAAARRRRSMKSTTGLAM